MPASISTFWSDAGHLLALERRAQLAERVPVLVDDGDRVALVLEDVGQRRADPPASHDHNVHDRPLPEYSASPELALFKQTPLLLRATSGTGRSRRPGGLRR
jgi:hypothetical protein